MPNPIGMMRTMTPAITYSEPRMAVRKPAVSIRAVDGALVNSPQSRRGRPAEIAQIRIAARPPRAKKRPSASIAEKAMLNARSPAGGAPRIESRCGKLAVEEVMDIYS